MSEDFKTESTRRRLLELDAMRQQQLANLATSEAEGDYEDAKQEIRSIANIDAERANIVALYNRHVSEQQPQYQERESIHDSRRTPRDGNDALEIVNYGKMPGDPTIVTADEYNRQQNRLYQLKAKGMYKE
jgi:DNA gyrase/topoisomerase IV subunit A